MMSFNSSSNTSTMEIDSLRSKNYSDWDTAEVVNWLDSIGLGPYKSSFLENEITGTVLVNLTVDDISEMGIKKIGHRKKLELEIQKLIKPPIAINPISAVPTTTTTSTSTTIASSIPNHFVGPPDPFIVSINPNLNSYYLSKLSGVTVSPPLQSIQNNKNEDTLLMLKKLREEEDQKKRKEDEESLQTIKLLEEEEEKRKKQHDDDEEKFIRAMLATEEKQQKESKELEKKYAEMDEKLAKSFQPKTCAICLDDVDIDFLMILGSCNHNYCRDCIANYFVTELKEKRLPLLCPECRTEVSPYDLEMLFTKDQLDTYQKFTLDTMIEKNPQLYSCCPTADCGYVFVWEKGESPDFKCLKCKKRYCLRCKCDYHEKSTCEQYQQWAKENGRGDDLFQEFIQGQNFKKCPGCLRFVEKESGCNHMTCRCGQKFCYACGNPYPCACGQDPHVVQPAPVRHVAPVPNKRPYRRR